MPIKHQDFIIQGMFRDTSEHAFDSKFAYENQNLRITAEPNADSEHSGDMLALTNEKGNKYIAIKGLDETGHNSNIKSGDMKGVPVGQCLINNQWVVFTTELPEEIFIDGEEKEIEDFPIEETSINNIKVNSLDRIYRLWTNNDVLNGELLYEGHLNFDYNCPIETLASYENEQIQKVYWTDGINQPRFINIVEKKEIRDKWIDTSFDFVSTINLLGNTIDVERLDSGGMFPAGKVQYCITYSNLFGTESNIVNTTQLYEIKFNNRGASPEEVVPCSFKIKINNIDTNFRYIHIYSIIRTSLDNVPICKLITKSEIHGSTFEFIDNNLYGEAIEPQSLFYKGGEAITAYTFENKDNTLFLGNYTLLRSYLDNSIRNGLRAFANNVPIENLTDRSYFDNTDNTNFKFDNGISLMGSDDIRDWMLNTETSYLYWEIDTPQSKYGINDWLHFDSEGDAYFYGNIEPNSSRAKLIDTFKYTPNGTYDNTYFRYNNIYRIGIQFQHETGKWSEVVWLGDYRCKQHVDWLKVKYDTLENGNVVHNEGYSDGVVFRVKPLGSIRLSNKISHIITKLIDLGYRRVRPVIVYPRAYERVCICQGFLNNTVFQGCNPFKNYPDYYVREYYSNIFEPYRNFSQGRLSRRVGTGYGTFPKIYNEMEGVLPANTNNIFIGNDKGWIIKPASDDYQADRTNTPFKTPYYEDSSSDYSNTSINDRVLDTTFYMDYTMVTLHSPDIEFDDSVKMLDYKNTKLQYIGTFGHYNGALSGWKNELNFQTSTIPKAGYWGHRALGISPSPKGVIEQGEMNFGGEHYYGGWNYEDSISNAPLYEDETLKIKRPTNSDKKTKDGLAFTYYNHLWKFPIYIWTSSGSISNDQEEEKPKSVLKSNKVLNAFKTKTYYEYDRIREYSIQDAQIWLDSYTMLKFTNERHKDIYYKGYVDTIVLPYTDGTGQIPTFAIYSSSDYASDYSSTPDLIQPKYLVEADNEMKDSAGMQAIQRVLKSCNVTVRYKTTPHLVILLNNKSVSLSNNKLITDNGNIFKELLTLSNTIPVVNIIRDINTDRIFGGYNDDALSKNSFIPCGDTVDICERYIEDDRIKYKPLNEINIVWKEGDTYSQDYECLKTYPWSLQEENSVTEIISTNLESYVNLNGRYDKNIGSPNLGTLPSNWNLRNNIYDQKNNFWTYHTLNLAQNSVNSFPNSFTWTLTKWTGDEIDKWTQITLASTMDVDGGKGNITKIIKFQDQLLCFQPNQLSQILYNEREQIATGSGVPIELANSGKVNGVRPITVIAGCNNKWSITKSERGLYWIDDVNRQILAWNGQIVNLSDTLGFHSWINEKASLNVWNPVSFMSFVSYYDPYNENIMFIYKDNVLSFNEQLNCFDTFLPYRYVPYYMAFNNTAFMLSNRDEVKSGDYKVWEMFKGNYNYFFVHDDCVYNNDELKLKGRFDKDKKPTNFGYEPYFTTILANPDMPYDKVFNNLDIRTDMWNKYGDLLEETFSHIETWNEFQWNKSVLLRQLDIPKLHYPAQHSILKKKFRVWYVNIPRDIKQSNPRLRYHNRDRMRNTWLYIKLSKELIDNDELINYPYISDNKHIIHHIGVSYFI